MKGSIVAFDEINGRRAAAQVIDGVLHDLIVAPPENLPVPGAIYRAVCDRPLKGQGGMMLRLPDGQTGFLRQGKGLKPGESLLVQVGGFAEAGKAVSVAKKILFKSRYAIVTPDAPGINVSRSIRDEERRIGLLELAHEIMGDASEGMILRSQAEMADDDDVAADIQAMLELSRTLCADAGKGAELLLEGPDPHDLGWRDWPQPDLLDADPGAFSRHGIDDMIDQLRTGRSQLTGGGHMYVETTRALVGVDVNTGGDMSTAAGLKANITAARVLPRVLRCRGLGGQIVVDFAPCAKKDRRQLEQVLRASFKADGIETSLVGWTQLGLFELQRKRERLSLELCLGSIT